MTEPRHLRTCTVDGCTNVQHSRGWCRKHYMRWWVHGDPQTAMFVPAAAGEPQAFIDALPETGEGCVRWPFSKNNMGYAQIAIAGKKFLVSRKVCERRNGPPPTSAHQAAHTCGKGHEACVAPWHLVWKTPAENNADQDTHGTRPRGEQSRNSVLTEADVVAIRARVATERQEDIAADYGVAQTTISHIVTGKTWRHVA